MSDRYGAFLGHGAKGPISLSKEARDVHMHVTGLSRQGKSYFLEHLIRQDIANGAGVCVIDPHGELYANLVDWCAANDMHKKRRIHLINPAKGEWSVGFNPLSRNDKFLDARVSAMIEACQKVWEDSQSTGYATLAKLLSLVFTTLAHHKLSLQESGLLTAWHHRDVRDRLVQATNDPILIDQWEELSNLTPADFTQRFEAVNNRLLSLTRSPGASTMLAQTEDAIDFKTCMDYGHVVLVNLAHEGRVPPNVAQTVGALVTADLFHSAQCRDINYAKTRPFYCYIDECGDYLNETIVKGLDQTAKFGLHYILSHQRLSQLGDHRTDPIRNGVMGGAQNKVVFLQEDGDTTSEMGELLFAKSFDLEKPKEVLIKPAVVGFQREWLASEGQAAGRFAAESSGYVAGSALGMSLAGTEGAVPVETETESHSETHGYSEGASSVRSTGRHEALIPIMEDLPGGVYSLEEMKHLAAVEVRMLQKRQAWTYCADIRVARQISTPDVFPARPTPKQVSSFYETIRKREKSANSVEEVQAAVAARRNALLEVSAEPEGFWQDT